MKKIFLFFRSIPVYVGDFLFSIIAHFGSRLALKLFVLCVMQAIDPMKNGYYRDLPIILDVALEVIPVVICVGTVLYWHEGKHGWNKQKDIPQDSPQDSTPTVYGSDAFQTARPEGKTNSLSQFTSSSYSQVSQSTISPFNDFEIMTIKRHYHVVEEIRTKVKGVTFRNDDGTDRQTILARCSAGDQLRFGFYRYKGDPAYTVTSEHGQLGNVSVELAEELYFLTSRLKNKHLILGEILNVSGGYHGESLGCNISITIYEKNY